MGAAPSLQTILQIEPVVIRCIKPMREGPVAAALHDIAGLAIHDRPGLRTELRPDCCVGGPDSGDPCKYK